MRHYVIRPAARFIASVVIPINALAAAPACEVVSGERQTPVIELYTSEGCSSCPPADQWLSTLKGKPVVAQAFHVVYWDYIGWQDRFANPAFTARQRELATINRLSGIYTPQLVRNGRDWNNWYPAKESVGPTELPRASIRLWQTDGANQFEARVVPSNANSAWTAYWTVTEHNHNSRVKAGENAGVFLKHDFVVRQFAQAGKYEGPQSLKFFSIAPQADHPRQINLIVSDPQSGQPLQAVSLQCS